MSFKDKYKNEFKKSFVNDNKNLIKNQLEFESDDEYEIIEAKSKNKRRLAILLSTISSLVAASLIILFTFIAMGNSNVVKYLSMEVINNKAMSLDYSYDDFNNEDDSEINGYARPGSEITIRIKFSNPKEYTILSFILNDHKYQGYEFLDGSDSENIYIKYKVSDDSGRYDISIGELMYVNSFNHIKNGRISGNDKIRIGVTYTNLPKITVINRELNKNKYSLSFNLIDKDSLCRSLNYYLFDNDNKYISHGLIKDEVNLSLSYNSKYKIKILSAFDLLDGDGIKSHVLYSDSIETKSPLIDLNMEFGYDFISLSPVLEEGLELISIKIGDKELANSFRFENLLSNTKYDVIIKYKDNNEVFEYTTKVSTRAYNNPDVEGDAILIGNSLILNYSLINNDYPENKDLPTYKVEIYFDGELYKTINSLNAELEATSSIAKVEIKIKISYDLNDGLGLRSTIINRMAAVEVSL